MSKICKNCKFVVIDAIGYKWCKARNSIPPQKHSWDKEECELFESNKLGVNGK